jgi:hypothetical protein
VKEIDFLPDWYKEERRRRVSMRRQFMALTIIFLTMLTYNMTAGHKIASATAGLEQREDQRLQAENVTHRFDTISEELKEYRVELDALQQADSRIDLAAVLAEASHIIGRHVALSRIEFIPEPISPRQDAARQSASAVRVVRGASKAVPLGDVRFKIVLAGVAANPADVGELVCQLDRSSYFQQAHFSFSRNSTIQILADPTQEQAKDATTRASASSDETFQVTEFEITCYLANYEEIDG